MDEKAVEEGKTRQFDLQGMSLVTFPDLVLCLPREKRKIFIEIIFKSHVMSRTFLIVFSNVGR